MHSFFELINEHAYQAHWIIFSLLILAGLNFPISEDLMIVTSGLIAATMIPENTFILFTAVFLGSYLSDWISYWLGRTLGRRLWKFKWFQKTVHPKRLLQAQHFYEKYGFFTLLIGRFIPFGVRNCLFITAGMGKMNFGKFITSDGIACLFSNATLFFITYALGKNYQVLLKFVKTFNIAIFSVFIVTLIPFIWYKLAKNKNRT
jgi:membrane-associated protein